MAEQITRGPMARLRKVLVRYSVCASDLDVLICRDLVTTATLATGASLQHPGHGHYRGNTRQPILWRQIVRNRIAFNHDLRHHHTWRAVLWGAIY